MTEQKRSHIDTQGNPARYGGVSQCVNSAVAFWYRGRLEVGTSCSICTWNCLSGDLNSNLYFDAAFENTACYRRG